MIFGLVRMWLNDLLPQVPPGQNGLWLVRMWKSVTRNFLWQLHYTTLHPAVVGVVTAATTPKNIKKHNSNNLPVHHFNLESTRHNPPFLKVSYPSNFHRCFAGTTGMYVYIYIDIYMYTYIFKYRFKYKQKYQYKYRSIFKILVWIQTNKKYNIYIYLFFGPSLAAPS